MDGPWVKQLWHCNPTPSNHKVMKIYSQELLLCTQAYYSTPVFLKVGAMETQRPQITKLWKLCSAVIKASWNKCLSIVMKLTGYLLSELFILLSINPKCNIIIFPDCSEIRGSNPGHWTGQIRLHIFFSFLKFPYKKLFKLQ